MGARAGIVDRESIHGSGRIEGWWVWRDAVGAGEPNQHSVTEARLVGEVGIAVQPRECWTGRVRSWEWGRLLAGNGLRDAERQR